MSLQDLMQDYYDVRTANATDLTVEQVKTINALEREYADHGEFTVEATRDFSGKPVEVTVEFEADQWAREYSDLDRYYFCVTVASDGTTARANY